MDDAVKRVREPPLRPFVSRTGPGRPGARPSFSSTAPWISRLAALRTAWRRPQRLSRVALSDEFFVFLMVR